MTALSKKPAAIRVVLPFVFRDWLKQPARALAIAAGGWARPSPTCSCPCSQGIWSMR